MSTFLKVACLVVAASAVTSSVILGKPVQKAAPTAVAVVDVGRVITESKYATKLLGAVRAEGARYEAELGAIREEIKKKSAALDLIAKDAPEREMKLLEIEALKQQMQGKGSIYQRRFREREAEASLAVFQKMDKAVNTLATKRGFDLVIKKKTEGAQMKKSDFGTRLRFHLSRNVYYFAGKVDITTNVVQLIDAQ